MPDLGLSGDFKLIIMDSVFLILPMGECSSGHEKSMRTTVTRILMAYFLVLLGVANVIVFDGKSAQGTDQEQVTINKGSHSLSELSRNTVGYDHHSSESAEGSCGDKDMCHKCHFGHCRMTIQSQQVYFSDGVQVFVTSESSVLLDRPLSAPFKPPIS